MELCQKECSNGVLSGETRLRRDKAEMQQNPHVMGRQVMALRSHIKLLFRSGLNQPENGIQTNLLCPVEAARPPHLPRTADRVAVAMLRSQQTAASRETHRGDGHAMDDGKGPDDVPLANRSVISGLSLQQYLRVSKVNAHPYGYNERSPRRWDGVAAVGTKLQPCDEWSISVCQ